MKRLLASLIAAVASLAAHAQSMGQPGFYGRIEIGNMQPSLLISNAVMGNPGVYTGHPVYMHVPPAHAHAWSRHCYQYGACDWLVYFVDNHWYETVYVPAFHNGAYPPPVYISPPVYVPYPYHGAPPHHHHHPPPPPVKPHHPGPGGKPPPGGSWNHGHHGHDRPAPSGRLR